MRIAEDYVSYEVAKLLKEKGFDEICRAVYEEKVLRINTLCDYHNSDLSSYVCASTLQMACKWLRLVHKLFIEIEVGVGAFTYSVVDMDNGNCVVRVGAVVGSFEDTLNTAIKDVLENLI